MNRKKILLVDDEESIRLSLGWALEKRGYAVTTAHDGIDAMDKVGNNAYDLIITELIMGEVDGINILKHAKTISPETAVIILTGFGNIGSAVKSLQYGADDYLQKPCAIEDLFNRTSKVIEKQDLTKQLQIRNDQITQEKTAREKIEKTLRELDENLEVRLSERTMHLTDTVDEMNLLIEELKAREEELEKKNKELEDMNTTLSTMMQRREKEQNEIKNRIAEQATKTVLPLIRKAERLTTTNSAVCECLKTAQANLLELLSVHAGDNRLVNARLAPRELQVINYIKQNKTSKEIADLLNLSVRTIESYRENIRKKLQIVNIKKTLKKFLISTL